jgi:hypothetical protein
MPRSFGEMRLPFAGTRRRIVTMKISAARLLTTRLLTARLFTTFARRIPAVPLPHFTRLAFKTLRLLVLPVAPKFLKPMPKTLGHRATRRRTIGPRLAGSFRSRRPGENQGGERGKEEACFHRPS